MPPIEDLAGTGANAPPMSENINNGNKADDATGANAPSHEPVTPAGERDLPFDVEHLGPLRRAVLDHLVDTDEPQSVAQVLAAMPVGTTRGSGESAIKRDFDAGRILRTSPGHYALGPARPPEANRPSTPPPPTPDQEATWF